MIFLEFACSTLVQKSWYNKSAFETSYPSSEGTQTGVAAEIREGNRAAVSAMREVGSISAINE